ncbi:Long chain acyl-CoA synthetase 7, peroxisomal [Tolypocladium capitatum]|uniref:Long chain acyl-CoA synthetase 7, peroxisomal n=1 Tax=Tolypocladium capitatum TaxID=45235 RepID=A0A2K3QJS8_9HYPO|nr:Long chain acyl-CoA synthetase 7, peroxisomal [Tolypocladium capitatum]
MAPAGFTVAEIKELGDVPPPGSPHGVAIPNTERPGRTAVYRNFRFRDRPLLTSYDPNIRSIHDLFENAARKRPNKRCLGTRNWNTASKSWDDKFGWLTYAEVAERRKRLGAGIVEIHQRIGHSEDKYGVGIWSLNRAEWQITDLALASQSLYAVSLYETLGPDATEYIINHAELTCVVCSLPHIPLLLKLAPRTPTLKLIVSMDPLDNGEPETHTKAAVLNELAAQHGIKVYSMQQVEEIGAGSGRPMRPAGWDDVSTINYTSGTTGAPKGVVLTHGNAVAANSTARLGGAITHNDVHLSYMPLAHIYGRMIDQLALAEGASIGFFRGDILGLVDDMKLLQPTGFISVPRLFNRFNSAIRTATLEAPGIRGALSRQVISTKKANMRAPPGQASNKHFLYDRIWTPKVRAAVGLDRVHSMISGSAQLDPDVQEFLRAAFGNSFSQGYGLTETYAVGTKQMNGDFSLGNVGPPMGCVEICLESVPEFEYSVDDKPNPRGEMLLRGPNVFKGYYKNDEETKKSLEPDGWFHTGDIAEVDREGRFKIIDRKKNVLKLSHGEYISPERIENVYLGNTNLVATAYVHGDLKESTLVAVFGIDPENFPVFASKVLKQTVPAGDLEAVKKAARDPKVRRAFVKVLDDIGRKHKFNSFERVRNVYLDIEPFSIENELLTPTLKLKRPQTAKAFRAQIDQMYEEIKAEAPANSAKL